MADFNIDSATAVQHLDFSPPLAAGPSEKVVQVQISELLEAPTNPRLNTHAISPSGPAQPFAPEIVERTEHFTHSLAESNDALATADDPLSRTTPMRQGDNPLSQIRRHSSLHARPALVSASSSIARQSLQTGSPSRDSIASMPSLLNSARFEVPLFGFPSLHSTMRPANSDQVNVEPGIFASNNTSRSWETSNLRPSPPSRSQSALIPNYNQPSLRQSSPSSGRSTPGEFSSHRRSRQGIHDYIDLTIDSSSPTMPAPASTLTPPRIQVSHEVASTSAHPSKRRKVLRPTSPNGESVGVKDEPGKIEEVDLRDIDDDTSLSKMLEQQRAETVKSQKLDGNQPIKLSSLQCIICMEPMTNITATHCGRSALSYNLLSASNTISYRSSLLSYVPNGSTHSWRAADRARQSSPLSLPCMSEEGTKASSR